MRRAAQHSYNDDAPIHLALRNGDVRMDPRNPEVHDVFILKNEEGRALDPRLFADDSSKTGATVIQDHRWPPSTPASTSPRSVAALPKWRLKRVIDFVDTHANRSLTLADLARTAGLSRMHFAAQFRQATGFRPHEYLLRHRIEKAKTILATSTRPIAEVALIVGFSSQGHFTLAFKRFTGTTPYRWRCALMTIDDAPSISRLQA